GSIEYRSWQDREGQTRYTTEISGRELIMLSGRGEGAESFEAKSAPAKAAAAMKGGGKTESLEDFPEALDGEDDDLPF
ncbi:MAG TPA: single-stranded DNA-binding protein, partial [Gemmatimonadales bacterium]|nr:single-stranded DNA-binding protein [Gemmatimonadales bacterium]